MPKKELGRVSKGCGGRIDGLLKDDDGDALCISCDSSLVSCYITEFELRIDGVNCTDKPWRDRKVLVLLSGISLSFTLLCFLFFHNEVNAALILQRSHYLRYHVFFYTED